MRESAVIHPFYGYKDGRLLVNPCVAQQVGLPLYTSLERIIYRLAQNSKLIDVASIRSLEERIPSNLYSIMMAVSDGNYQQAVTECYSAVLESDPATISMINIVAYMIKHGKVEATEDSFQCVGLAMPKGNRFAKAAVLYRHVVTLKSATSANDLGYMLMTGKISAIEDGSQEVNPDVQAAAFYHDAARLGSASAIGNLAYMILNRYIIPNRVPFDYIDFDTLPTNTDTYSGRLRGEHFILGVALFRHAAKLGCLASIYTVAYMIWVQRFRPSDYDFKCVGLETMPEGDHFFKAATLYRYVAKRGCAAAICSLALIIESGQVAAMAEDCELAGLDVLQDGELSSVLPVMLCFKAASHYLRCASVRFTFIFEGLTLQDKLTCAKHIVAYLIARPIEDIPPKLFLALVGYKSFIVQYLLSEEGKAVYNSSWRDLIYNANALGSLINYARRGLSKGTVQPPGKTASSQKIKEHYGAKSSQSSFSSWVGSLFRSTPRPQASSRTHAQDDGEINSIFMNPIYNSEAN
jgi:TPR repeat protein